MSETHFCVWMLSRGTLWCPSYRFRELVPLANKYLKDFKWIWKWKLLLIYSIIWKYMQNKFLKCSVFFKANFYQIFVFPPNDSPSKTIKSVFYFIKKALFVFKYSKFCNFFPSFPHFPDTNGQNNLWCNELACINLQMQFLK